MVNGLTGVILPSAFLVPLLAREDRTYLFDKVRGNAMRCFTRIEQIVGLSVAVVLLGGEFVHGQIWTGNGDGETWLDGSNWDAGIAPQVPGQTASFDANFGVPLHPIQISGPIAISGINVLNAPGNVRIADDEPFHPFLVFELDGGGSAVPIKLDATPGYSLSFEESINALQFNDDVEVDHHGTSERCVCDPIQCLWRAFADAASWHGTCRARGVVLFLKQSPHGDRDPTRRCEP